MDMHVQRTLRAPRDRVWQALNDPATLRQCLPGCEEIVSDGDDRFRVTMAVKVGPVAARFRGSLALLDVVPRERYRLRFEGQAGAAGFARGEAAVVLRDALDGTELAADVQAQVGGKVAQVGSRLVDGAAAKVADDFFARLAQVIEPTPASEPAAAGASDAALEGSIATRGEAQEAPVPASSATNPSRSAWHRHRWWLALAAVLLAALLLWARRAQ